MNSLRARGCFKRCMRSREFKVEGLILVEVVEVVEGVEGVEGLMFPQPNKAK